MKRWLFIVSAGLAIGVTAQCFGQQSEASAKDQQSLDELAKKWAAAYNAKNATGVAALYTDNAIRVAPDGIVQGRLAIRKAMEDQFKAGGHDISISIKSMRSLGDVSWATGDWSAKFGDQPAHGWWANVQVRSGGDWKIEQNAFNLAPPAQGSAQAKQ